MHVPAGRRARGAPGGAGRQPRQAEQRHPRRQVQRTIGSSRSARTRVSSRSAGPGHGRSARAAAPQLGLPGRIGRGPGGSSPAPRRAASRGGAARSGRTARRGGGRCSAGGAPTAVRSASSRARDGRRAACSHGSPQRRRRRPRAAATPTRSGSHGSASGSIPDAAATASPISRRGDGNSTFAQTPSRRPGEAPSDGGQALREPALHPARRHGDDLGRERVVERRREQLAERVDEPVCAFGSVDVEHAYLILSLKPPVPIPSIMRTSATEGGAALSREAGDASMGSAPAHRRTSRRALTLPCLRFLLFRAPWFPLSAIRPETFSRNYELF